MKGSSRANVRNKNKRGKLWYNRAEFAILKGFQDFEHFSWGDIYNACKLANFMATQIDDCNSIDTLKWLRNTHCMFPLMCFVLNIFQAINKKRSIFVLR